MALTAWERLQAADKLVDLVAMAIRLRHPSAAKLAGVTVTRALRLTDEKLLAAIERLEAWIEASQPAVDARVQAAVALTGGPISLERSN